ncbi:MAG: hypothetical protein NTZ18_00625 [Candidatus Komeilibacteria bacterium]|nr:hypothetical protein [Candidatus Komeilibacteria bacterium]
MKPHLKLTKAEKRELLKIKERFAPKGGTLSGQIVKMKTSKGYLKRKKNI